MKLGKSSLNDIAKIRPDSVKRKRISSYDRTGGNHDWIDVKPGECVVLGEKEGAGCINHFWCTMSCKSKYYLRNIIIRMYWDGESDQSPSVEVPIGDFFGVGHAKKVEFVSLPLQMTPRGGRGFNCWWPMPFSTRFKITLENDNPNLLKFTKMDLKTKNLTEDFMPNGIVRILQNPSWLIRKLERSLPNENQ